MSKGQTAAKVEPEDNVLDFPKVETQSEPTPTVPPVSYHFAAFRVGADGKTTWFDGVVGLDGVILTQEHYQTLKKLLCQNYDIREDNFVITSLTRLDTMQFQLAPIPAVTENQEG